MDEDILTTQLTDHQRQSITKLTNIIPKWKLGKIELTISELEKEGFSLVPSAQSQEDYSVLMPSGRVLDVAGNKKLLDNTLIIEDLEMSHACLYFGFYLGCLY